MSINKYTLLNSFTLDCGKRKDYKYKKIVFGWPGKNKQKIKDQCKNFIQPSLQKKNFLLNFIFGWTWKVNGLLWAGSIIKKRRPIWYWSKSKENGVDGEVWSVKRGGEERKDAWLLKEKFSVIPARHRRRCVTPPHTEINLFIYHYPLFGVCFVLIWLILCSVWSNFDYTKLDNHALVVLGLDIQFVVFSLLCVFEVINFNWISSWHREVVVIVDLNCSMLDWLLFHFGWDDKVDIGGKWL